MNGYPTIHLIPKMIFISNGQYCILEIRLAIIVFMFYVINFILYLKLCSFIEIID